MSSSIDSILPHLLERPLPPLEPGKTVYAPELAKQIMGLEEHDFVKASLHLMNDDIQHAHLIAQQNEGVGGPYLALLSSSDSRRIQREIFCMQRCIDEKGTTGTLNIASLPLSLPREADNRFLSWWNSLTKHPLVPSKPDAKAFVDACERVRQGNEDEEKCKARQWEEMKGLVEWTRANCR